MRLDKFLKVSRLIKRRTVAKEISDQGRILINGNAGKASSTIQPGDELQIRFGQKIVTVKVEDLKETTKKEDAASMYSIVSEQRINDDA
ncbi:RNA-binding S4 domain-containing protein [Pseudalkalibacillus sp. Hm43]|uniref:RNA-binding S4 domain-containing protein n=1 Tax=Pseudalkalibacillus sp. Hm43 TaxID=3450742 RepID=UPI003F423241